MSSNKKHESTPQEIENNAIGYWTKYSKTIVSIVAALVILVGGYFAYVNFIQLPKQEKASEEMFSAEKYFRTDSFNLALNGNASSAGFLKIIKKYDGTQAANLAKLYAGESYLHIGEFQKAIDLLSEFNAGSAKQVAAKVEGLLGDAYAELKKNEDAITHYKKAATLFEEDQAISSEYLFRGALLSEVIGKNDQAIELYQQLKEKYPRTEKGFVVDKYLARLGVIK
ncbi:MAG: tetratricopeptide repeat protein [bacterium]|jgi:tetratricopeptide (TPR) repeat protein